MNAPRDESRDPPFVPLPRLDHRATAPDADDDDDETPIVLASPPRPARASPRARTSTTRTSTTSSSERPSRRALPTRLWTNASHRADARARQTHSTFQDSSKYPHAPTPRARRRFERVDIVPLDVAPLDASRRRAVRRDGMEPPPPDPETPASALDGGGYVFVLELATLETAKVGKGHASSTATTTPTLFDDTGNSREIIDRTFVIRRCWRSWTRR